MSHLFFTSVWRAVLRLIDSTNHENWAKVKAALEAAGKTSSPFYTRACAIVRGLPDPGDNPYVFNYAPPPD
jgi:hypothetical protein